MTVGELILKLQELPQNWHIHATNSGSLEFCEHKEKIIGQEYGFLFTDNRRTIYYQRKKVNS